MVEPIPILPELVSTTRSLVLTIKSPVVERVTFKFVPAAGAKLIAPVVCVKVVEEPSRLIFVSAIARSPFTSSVAPLFMFTVEPESAIKLLAVNLKSSAQEISI